MSDEAAEIAAELRRHLAWQQTDGSRLIWKDPNVVIPAIARAPPGNV